MNDIQEYESFYRSDDEGFERFQVQYRRKKLIEVFDSLSHKNVLDIGCGLEPLFSYLDLNGTETYTVIEPVEFFCENAEKAKNHEKVTIVNDYAENFQNVSNTKFDLIICSSLLHEVQNQRLLLEAIKKQCNKDTVVHINVPNALSIHRLLAKEMSIINDAHDFSQRDKMRQHTKVFDMCSFQGMLEDNGFEIIEKGSYFVKLFTHDQMQACMDAEIMNTRLLDGLYQLVKYMPEYGSEIYCNVKLR